MYFDRFELKKLQNVENEFALVLYLDSQWTEFATELGKEPGQKRDVLFIARSLVESHYPKAKVTVIKVMVGGMLITSIPFVNKSDNVEASSTSGTIQTEHTSSVFYRVKPGDTLWLLTREFNTSIDNIKRGNNLITDTLQPNQHLVLPRAFHTVRSGDSLSVIARDYQTTVPLLREANRLATDTIRIGQVIIIPIVVNQVDSTQTPISNNLTPQSQKSDSIYTVVSGDSLSVIAQRFGTTVTAISEANNLGTNVLQIGQRLVIPTVNTDLVRPTEPISEATPTPATYTVISGDSLSVIAQRFGTTVTAISEANNLGTNVLQIGQRLVIPTVNTDLVRPTEPIPEATPTPATYTVVSGDSLSVIAQRFNTTVTALRSANNLTSDVIRVGQTLTIPTGVTSEAKVGNTPATSELSTITHTIVSGDNLWTLAQRYGTTVDALRNTNNLKSDVLQIGQRITIPAGNTNATQQPTAPIQERTTFTYRVVAGDSLSVIAQRHGVTVDSIRTANTLRTDVLQIGQTLTIPNGINAPATNTKPVQQNGSLDPVTMTNIQHTIRSGDNMWNLSQQYGVPYLDLLRHNNMTERSTLKIGQVIQIPQYHVPVRPVVSQRHGEVLDWWTEARYVFSTGKVATITDFQTGRQFQVRHTMGGNHADSEPLTARDAQIMREIWGGSYSWTPRAIIVEVDGRRLAAAMHSMPHGDQVIRDNNYNGHFCIHFVNSTRHSDGLVQDTMHRQIEIAAGRSIR